MPTRWLYQLEILVALFAGIFHASLRAEDPDFSPLRGDPTIVEVGVGVTPNGTKIPAFITHDDLDIHVKKLRILIVAGLDGSAGTTKAAIHVMKRFHSDPAFELLRKGIAISTLPCGNPDGLRLGRLNDNGFGGDPSIGYPPPGDSYNSPTCPESQYIWRWIGMHAPDLMIELVDADPEKKSVEFIDALKRPENCLAGQLSKTAACQVGNVQSHTVAVPKGNTTPFDEIAKILLADVDFQKELEAGTTKIEYSKARLELQRRDKRTPMEVCIQLAKVYGHELNTVAYIPAVACIGRMRMAKLAGNQAETLADLERITAEYLSGSKPTLNEKSGGSEFAGHLLWGELFDVTKNENYIKLVLKAADRAFDNDGKPLVAMPTHSEMSDSVFMGCPILAQAGRLTGDAKYFDMCLAHMRFMLKLNLRSDGLHRHSPLDETAWGRGNGFPALGLALALEDIPHEYVGRKEMLEAFQDHLFALLPYQDPTGTWHQVIDHPESYRELTCTCMITYAMVRGMRRGWLPKEKFRAAAERGWTAIKARVAEDGSLVDVCTGTGKQKSLRDYYDRTAILGPDPRGGAMSLLVATEIAAWDAKGH
jgi:unsaturated rhamnogalacturonyl hydrolase